MRALALAFAVLLLPAAAGADPLKSPACSDAIARLDAARGSETAGQRRQEAVRTCLGGDAPSEPRANRWAVEPIRVPAPVIVPPQMPPAALAPRPLPPPVAIERPATITSCDAHGCWASDGARLQRIGPGLGGPCVVTGASAFCH